MKIEKKLEAKRWDICLNLSIFAMVVVDTWLVYSQCTGDMETKEADFYLQLAEELIDNEFAQVGARGQEDAKSIDADSPLFCQQTG